MKFEKHIAVGSTSNPSSESAATDRIVDLIAAEVDLSKPVIKQAMNKGAVWLTSDQSTRRVRRADKQAKPGDSIHVYYDNQVLEQEPTPATLISDEVDYSIWHKPYGMLCQGSKWGDHCTINRWVETHHQPQKPAFIVHRLDRAASGLIVLVHKKKIAAYFSNLFQQREIEKTYQAIVAGEFPKNLKLDTDIDGKKALTEASLLSYDSKKNHSKLSVKIETGRKHQIRKHLSEAGFPIVGDRLYSHQNWDDSVNLRLASCYLAFQCPVEQRIKEFRLPDHLLPEL